MNNKANNTSYDRLKTDLKNVEIGKCYIFHGEEQYLLMHSLNKLRALMCPGGLDSFNYKRFEGESFTPDMLVEATEMFPFSAERTLIEIHEYELFKCEESERNRMIEVLADLPEYACVVFVYSAAEYKPDGRLKTTKELQKYAFVVEFPIQEENRLAKWVVGHFSDAGKEISLADAKYLSEITGGLMNTLEGEIEKIAAFAKGDKIKRSDIDAVVIPILDIQAYRLTDAIVRRDKKQTLQILDTLLQMREVPHKLMYSISLKMRQLLAARVCIDNKTDRAAFKKMCDIRSDYPADILMYTARKTSLAYCRNAVLMCCKTAKELNSMSDPEARIVELVLKLSLV